MFNLALLSCKRCFYVLYDNNLIIIFVNTPIKKIKTEKDQLIYTVTELTREIKYLLETTIPVISIKGEISNFTHHSSGHMYFSLKDEGAQISCVMWRNRNIALPFKPEDGIMVIASGRVTVYEKRGTYQLDIHFLQPAGIGALQIAFEQLKQRLKEEGLFDQQHKKELPLYPFRIGIVTSPTGAAIQDLVTVLNRRFPSAEIILRPVHVQGEGAAEDISTAVAEFNEYGQVDILIVGRGGGSLEDLWAFNEEIVARAIFNSNIPVISAVGHEVDFSIADFVADVRAPTPSAAAEIAVKDKQDLIINIQKNAQTCFKKLTDKIEIAREKLKTVILGYGFRRPGDLILQYKQRLDELQKNQERAILHKLTLSRGTYEQLMHRLTVLGPKSILRRGYSICWKPDDGKIIRNAKQLSKGETVAVHFYEGGMKSVIEQVLPDEKLSQVGSKSLQNPE